MSAVLVAPTPSSPFHLSKADFKIRNDSEIFYFWLGQLTWSRTWEQIGGIQKEKWDQRGAEDGVRKTASGFGSVNEVELMRA